MRSFTVSISIPVGSEKPVAQAATTVGVSLKFSTWLIVAAPGVGAAWKELVTYMEPGVGVAVGVLVAVFVGVLVGVGVAVLVAVLVGVAVGVLVGVSVG